MQVSQLMNKNVIKVAPDDSTAVAARLLSRHNIGSLPVCTPDGRLRGIITDRDIALRLLGSDAPSPATRVKEIMTRRISTVSPSADVREAAAIMARDKVRRLPVCEGETVVGILALSDIAKKQQYETEAAEAFFEISSNLRRPHGKPDME